MDYKLTARITAEIDQRKAEARDRIPEAKVVLERLLEEVTVEDLGLLAKNFSWSPCYEDYDGIVCVADLYAPDALEGEAPVAVAIGRVNPLEATRNDCRLIETCEISTFGPEDVETLEDVLERLRGCRP